MDDSPHEGREETRLDEQERKAILTIALMAAFADGANDDTEREAVKRIAESLGGDGAIDAVALYQDVLLKRVTLADAAKALATEETRRLAFEMAVCVCDADGAQSPAERTFLESARVALGLEAAGARAYTEAAESIAAAPLATPPGAPAAAAASTLDDAAIDKLILDAAIRNGALELLPESLATMAILPLQMRLVYRIGRSFGFDLERGQIQDLLGTLGVGLTSQYLEQAGRKLLGGVLGVLGGGLLRGVGKQAVSSGMSFASTYALGQVARRYYASGRTLSGTMLKETFSSMLADAKQLETRYRGEMQTQSRGLDTAKLVEMVRNG